MARRSLSLLVVTLAVVLALPALGSQFLQLPFDTVARNATLIVRGTVGPVTSAWDDDHRIIYSYAALSVDGYLAGHGPDTLMIREVGGTVEGYTQVAIGFPALREGQEVVLFLARWDDCGDWRIDSYNQGKYRVRMTPAGAVVSPDPETQGHEGIGEGGRIRSNSADDSDSMRLEELATMIAAARSAGNVGTPDNRRQN